MADQSPAPEKENTTTKAKMTHITNLMIEHGWMHPEIKSGDDTALMISNSLAAVFDTAMAEVFSSCAVNVGKVRESQSLTPFADLERDFKRASALMMDKMGRENG